jgi:hypothetical protein
MLWLMQHLLMQKLHPASSPGQLLHCCMLRPSQASLQLLRLPQKSSQQQELQQHCWLLLRVQQLALPHLTAFEL